MVSEGESAPQFTAPLANGSVDEFDLGEAIDEDAPVVLAFFPGAFTGVCTHEMNEFQNRLDDFASAGATVYGLSVDLPYALNEFREQEGLSFGLISDSSRDIVDQFDISMDFAASEVYDLAKRSVFVIDGEGTIRYAWVSDDASLEPDYDEVLAAAEAAA